MVFPICWKKLVSSSIKCLCNQCFEGKVFYQLMRIKDSNIIKFYIYRFSFKFYTVLYQFLETETSVRTVRSQSTP